MHTPIQPPAPVNPVITIQPVTVTAPNPEGDSNPNPLAKLPTGTVVEGFVINRDTQNNPILRTSIGDLRVSSEFFLKTGSEVVFKVDTSQTSLARILTVDGLTPENYNAQNARGLTKDTITATALQPSLAALTQNADADGTPTTLPILQALVLRAAAQATTPLNQAQTAQVPLLAQLTQLSAGTPLRLTLHDLKLPPLPVSINTIPDAPALNQLLPQRSATPQLTAQATPNAATPQTQSSIPQSQQSAAQPITSPTQQPMQQTSAPISAPTRADAPLPQAQQFSSEIAPIYAAIQRQQVHNIIRQAGAHSESLLLQSESLNPNKPATTNTQQTQTVTTAYTAPQPKLAASVPTDTAKSASPTTTATTASTLTPAANQLVANVIGHDADGANILHTNVATLKLYTTQPLPTGTSLLVSAEIDTESPQQPVVPALAEQKIIAAVKHDYGAVEEMITWLSNHQPEFAQQLQQRLPTLDHKLTSTLLFFISALKTGDVNEIFGKRATRQLEISAPALLTRLREDISQISANMVDSPLNNWTMIPLPMLHGQELHQAQLYVSKEPKEQTGGGKDHGQRFVLEVELSQLGPMQFDGFIRNHEQGKNFDLIVRTEQPISPDISQGIRDIFNNSLQITGLFGQLIFQQGSQHFFKPQLEAIRKPDTDSQNTILA